MEMSTPEINQIARRLSEPEKVEMEMDPQIYNPKASPQPIAGCILIYL